MDTIRDATKFLAETNGPQSLPLLKARAIVANLIPIAESSLLSLEARVKATRGGDRLLLKSLASVATTYASVMLRSSTARGIPSLKICAGNMALLCIHLAHATGCSLDSLLREAVARYEGEPCPKKS